MVNNLSSVDTQMKRRMQTVLIGTELIKVSVQFELSEILYTEYWHCYFTATWFTGLFLVHAESAARVTSPEARCSSGRDVHGFCRGNAT